jgi:hypothetical protein
VGRILNLEPRASSLARSSARSAVNTAQLRCCAGIVTHANSSVNAQGQPRICSEALGAPTGHSSESFWSKRGQGNIRAGLGESPRCQLREKVFLPGRAFPGCSFREMQLVAHTESLSLFFCGLAAGYLVQFWLWTCSFEECPRVRVVHRPYFPPTAESKRQREADEDEGPLSV